MRRGILVIILAVLIVWCGRQHGHRVKQTQNSHWFWTLMSWLINSQQSTPRQRYMR